MRESLVAYIIGQRRCSLLNTHTRRLSDSSLYSNMHHHTACRFAQISKWLASTIMYAIYWLVASLFCRTLALPATTSLPSTLQDFKPANFGAILNDTLVGENLPWGPAHFSVDIDETITQSPIDRRVFFVTTIQLLASQVTLDFNGPLTSDIGFSTPQFPDLGIAVRISGPQRPFRRKYIFGP